MRIRTINAIEQITTTIPVAWADSRGASIQLFSLKAVGYFVDAGGTSQLATTACVLPPHHGAVLPNAALLEGARARGLLRGVRVHRLLLSLHLFSAVADQEAAGRIVGPLETPCRCISASDRGRSSALASIVLFLPIIPNPRHLARAFFRGIIIAKVWKLTHSFKRVFFI